MTTAPRTSGLLVASLVLSGISLLPGFRLGPLGPLAAGVLAFLGYGAVRRSGGTLRGPLLARAAMTGALVALGLVAWSMIRHEATTRAWGEIRSQVARVEENLRRGTAEGAWDLLGPGARAAKDRAPFVKEMRAAMARLGSLDSLGDATPAGGDWDRTRVFDEGERAELRLPMDFDGRFQLGRGRIRLEVLVRREGRVVTGEIADLRVEPGG